MTCGHTMTNECEGCQIEALKAENDKLRLYLDQILESPYQFCTCGCGIHEYAKAVDKALSEGK